MKRCISCHAPISAARLAALPQTKTCAEHSTERPMKGYMSWEHKTAPVIQVVPQREYETYKRYDRKGVRSGLPMSPRTVAGTTGSVTPVISASDASNTMNNRRTAESTIPRARCHADRPQVSATGHCLECAAEYYSRRMSWKFAEKTF